MSVIKILLFAGHSISTIHILSHYSLLITHPSQSMTLGSANKSMQIFTFGPISFQAMQTISFTAFSWVVLYTKLETFQVTQSSTLSFDVGYLQIPQRPTKRCISFWAVKNTIHSNIISQSYYTNKGMNYCKNDSRILLSHDTSTQFGLKLFSKSFNLIHSPFPQTTDIQVQLATSVAETTLGEEKHFNQLKKPIQM